LAGGRSSRFGSDKADALLDGRPMVHHVCNRLTPQTDTVAIVGGSSAYGLSIPLLDDGRHRGEGPVAGILAGLHWGLSMGARYIVSAPCDVPMLPSNLVQLLNRASSDRPSVLQMPGGLEPACARWPTTAIARIETLLSVKGRRSLQAALNTCDAEVIRVEDSELEGSFANINTPGELARLGLSIR